MHSDAVRCSPMRGEGKQTDYPNQRKQWSCNQPCQNRQGERIGAASFPMPHVVRGIHATQPADYHLPMGIPRKAHQVAHQVARSAGPVEGAPAPHQRDSAGLPLVGA